MKKNLIIISLVTIFLSACAALPILDTGTKEREYDKNFAWGINGHPVWSKDYESIPLQQQINLLKEHQLDFYRINIPMLANGEVSTDQKERFKKLLNLADSNDIQILPILGVYKHLEDVDFRVNNSKAFEMGFKQAKGFLDQYGKHFHYYELGNEMDIKTIREKNFRGKEISDYKLDEMDLIASYLKGMIAAIKKSDPSSKVLINISGWLRWGFLDYMVGKGVEFDILSYHWYSEKGLDIFDINNPNYDIYSTLVQKFNKPIWLTEINKLGGDIYGTEKQQAEMMNLYFENLKKLPYIQGFFVYELYDQPLHWAGNEEANFGIIQWKDNPPNYARYEYKPASKILKLKIEEAKSGAKDYIYSILKDFYSEEPTEEEINHWLELYKRSSNKEMLVKEILRQKNNSPQKSIENLNTNQDIPSLIQSSYQSLLERNPNEKETRYWKREIKKQKSQQEIEMKIILSQEYWDKSIKKGYERNVSTKKLN